MFWVRTLPQLSLEHARELNWAIECGFVIGTFNNWLHNA